MSGQQERVTNAELLDIAERLAQELQDAADQPGTRGDVYKGAYELLDEWHAIWRRAQRVGTAAVVESPPPGIGAYLAGQ